MLYITIKFLECSMHTGIEYSEETVLNVRLYNVQ